jgi:hypothetical protein
MAKKVRRKKGAAKKKRFVKKAKKRPVRRKAAKKGKKKPARRGVKARAKGVQKRRPEIPSEPIARVTHYFPHVKAAAVMVDRDGIRVGDTLYFKGHTTRFKQTVESLQINHQPVTQASPGEEAGIRVKSRVREHDLVFKL